MKPNKHIILGVHITDRVKHAGNVQQVFTRFGAHIKTRLGLHEVMGRKASPNGLILLELACNETQCSQMVKALRAVRGIEVQKMVFDHP